MPRFYAQYPSVNESLQAVRDNTFRGNTFGQSGVYSEVTPEMREVANEYDVHNALVQAIQERKLAGLSA